jgi:hypothetical protein
MGWTVRGSKSGGGKIFRARARPDRPQIPPRLRYKATGSLSRGQSNRERGAATPAPYWRRGSKGVAAILPPPLFASKGMS